LNCAQYEFEESDRQKAKLRLKMGNRYGRTQNEALQPATILNAHKVTQTFLAFTDITTEMFVENLMFFFRLFWLQLTTRQIRLLEHHNAELLHREIDRILTRSNGWIGDLDGVRFFFLI
jgi:hypothetical protein